jgi:hypothetical protein
MRFGPLFLSDAISLNRTWREARFQKLILTKEEMREERPAGEIKQFFNLNTSVSKSR